MRRARGFIIGCCALVLWISLAGCPREKRELREIPAMDARSEPVRLTTLQPGAALPARQGSGPYEGNAPAIAEGEQLYEQYNCVGCHFHGGGGIGPPLMDPQWIYGGSGRNIHDTIVQGRPNGMPSYGGHIPDDQIWKITAYVRTLSGQVPKPNSPTRSDELFPHPSEQAMPKQKPKTQEASHPG
ncbi:MAG TPA: c-type cytochrome [Thermoanaerobaculia bacterium]|jgi:cytochrome c oxidase cbb3-type subunit 3